MSRDTKAERGQASAGRESRLPKAVCLIGGQQGGQCDWSKVNGGERQQVWSQVEVGNIRTLYFILSENGNGS